MAPTHLQGLGLSDSVLLLHACITSFKMAKQTNTQHVSTVSAECKLELWILFQHVLCLWCEPASL